MLFESKWASTTSLSIDLKFYESRQKKQELQNSHVLFFSSTLLLTKQEVKEIEWQSRPPPGIGGTVQGLRTPAETRGRRRVKWASGDGDVFHELIIKEPIGAL